MAGIHVAGGVGSHLVAGLGQPVAKVDFDPFRHAPGKVELGGGGT